MESKQAEMIDNLKQRTTREGLDYGTDYEGFTPVSMMVLPYTANSDSSSKEASKTHLTLFSGQAIPHFYQWKKDVLNSLKLLKISPSLQGRRMRIRTSIKTGIETEIGSQS